MTLISPSLQNPQSEVNVTDLLAPALLVLSKAHEAKMPGVTLPQMTEALRRLNRRTPGAPTDAIDPFAATVSKLVGAMRQLGLSYEHRRTATVAPGVFVLAAKGKALLAKNLIGGIGFSKSAPPAGQGRTLEKAIIKPALFYIALRGLETGKPVPMSDVRVNLREALPKSEGDLAILLNRKDAKIDQVIRNLISHNALVRNGWVKRTEEGLSVTNAGYAALLPDLVRSLPSPPLFDAPPPVAAPRRSPTL
jgi:hypothetical protein